MANTGQPIEAEAIRQYAAGVVDGLANGSFAPAMQECYTIVKQAHRDNFTSSAGPDGSAWPARKVQGDGHPLLAETGALLQAATGGGMGHIARLEDRQMETGVDKSVEQGGIPGAAVHEFGYAPKNIPARPWLGASEEKLKECDEIIADAGLAFF